MNLMPSLKQKETIIQETGVDKKRLESWFYRARKKMKRSHTDVANPAPPVTKAYSDLLNAATQAPSTMDSSAMEIDNATPTNKTSTESNEDDTFKA
jgi:hypothetical protein